MYFLTRVQTSFQWLKIHFNKPRLKPRLYLAPFTFYGISFEQFLGMELRAYLSYRRIKEDLTFWRSNAGHEVDFVVGDHSAIEVKSTTTASFRHRHGLLAIQEEKILKNFYLVTQDRIEAVREGIHHLYWGTFLEKLWGDEIIS